MPKKEIVQVNPAAPNPNLSAATKFGNLVFVSGQTGRPWESTSSKSSVTRSGSTTTEQLFEPSRSRHSPLQFAFGASGSLPPLPI